MKKSFALIVLTIILASCTHHPSQKSQRELDNLHGDVKSVFSMEFHAYNQFGADIYVKDKPKSLQGTFYTEYDSTGNITLRREYYLPKVKKSSVTMFDSEGRKTDWKRLTEDGKSIRFHYKYEYDEHGNLLRETELTKNKIYTNYVNSYDNNGRLTKQKETLFYGRTTTSAYKYDNEGKLIQEEEFGDPKFVHKYEYDENGNCCYTFVSMNDRIPTHIFKKYDSLNRLIEVVTVRDTDRNSNIIESRTRNYYKGKDNKYYMSKMWLHNGVECTLQYVYMQSLTDTLTEVMIRDSEIYNVIGYSKGSNYTEETYFDIEGGSVNSLNYIYNDGLLTEIKSKASDKVFEYDKNHKLVSTTETNTFRKTISKYSNSRICSETVFDDDNDFISERTYQYKGTEDNGSSIITEVDHDGVKKVSATEYTNGLKVKVSVTEGKSNYSEVYEYNNHNDPIRIAISDGNETSYEYEYDAKGNWTKRITFQNGTIKFITERSIDYYSL